MTYRFALRLLVVVPALYLWYWWGLVAVDEVVAVGRDADFWAGLWLMLTIAAGIVGVAVAVGVLVPAMWDAVQRLDEMAGELDRQREEQIRLRGKAPTREAGRLSVSD